MSEQTEKRHHRAVGGLTIFNDGMVAWLRFRGRISYRKVLVFLAIAIALYTGANVTTVLEWLKNVLALLGIG
jgi:hypothetical protein